MFPLGCFLNILRKDHAQPPDYHQRVLLRPADRAIEPRRASTEGPDRPMCAWRAPLIGVCIVASRRLVASRFSKTNGRRYESIMPKQRRSLACQHCKRLKTRCDLPPDAVTCSRCKNLRYVKTDSCSQSLYSMVTFSRLECVMPLSMVREIRASSSAVTTTSNDDHQPSQSCGERQVYNGNLHPPVTDLLKFECNQCLYLRDATVLSFVD